MTTTGSLLPLIGILSDGRFHSGSELGRQLGISRSAIWKNICKFAELGLEVHAVRGKGYKLKYPLTLLESSRIYAGIPDGTRSSILQLEILDTIDSTNSHAMRLIQQGKLSLQPGQYSIHLAEQQSDGKGRRGRQWISPFGQNIYLTMVRLIDTGVIATEGITLAVGLAIIRALSELEVPGLGVKWPNDILVEGRKLAGILLEISGDISGICQLTIGVGINVRNQPESMEQVSQPWTDLYQVTGKAMNRNLLVSQVVCHIMSALKEFENNGLKSFIAEWQDNDVMKDQQVELVTTRSSVQGIARGISETGALLLETSQGMQVINGGEVSLRKSALNDS